ncbi:DUF308 domain-containing protein [Reyranella sp.]|uniref:DUF308 domain-containing protein n=1 Tax=Reyranella sp. TaxID=1929291 RepID=UPI003BAC771E
MSIEDTGPEARRHVAEVFHLNWLWLVLLGAVLVVAGAVAIAVPALSAIPANNVLGSVLVVSGGLHTMQAAKILYWTGFIWHLMLGALAVAGGALIHLDPFAGIVTITILIAILFAVHGATQIVLAWKVRQQARCTGSSRRAASP